MRKKMNKNVKKKWLRALRSEEYKQARGLLINKKHSMCCLAVCLHTCNLMSKEEICSYQSRHWGNMPPKMRDIVKISRNTHDELIDMNDKKKKNFVQIADWIETNI